MPWKAVWVSLCVCYSVFASSNHVLQARAGQKLHHALTLWENWALLRAPGRCSATFRGKERCHYHSILAAFGFFFKQAESLVVLKNCFLSSKLQLMREEQFLTCQSEPAGLSQLSMGWTCWGWERTRCQTGHLWKAIFSLMAHFLKKESLSVRPLRCADRTRGILHALHPDADVGALSSLFCLGVSVLKTLDQTRSSHCFFFLFR